LSWIRANLTGLKRGLDGAVDIFLLEKDSNDVEVVVRRRRIMGAKKRSRNFCMVKRLMYVWIGVSTAG